MTHDIDNDPSRVPYSHFAEAFARFRKDHEKLLVECTSPDKCPIDAIRHIVAAALRRSDALTTGFVLLVDHRNRFSAIPLVRLQLDSAMRIHACRLVDSPSELVAHLLTGSEPRKYPKKSTLLLTDRSLHESLSKLYPLTSDLYGETNGYVHLSTQHLFGFFDFELLKTGNVRYTDHESLQPWSDSERKEALTGMLWATDVLTEECNKLLTMFPTQPA
jgi:hypothetical protein